MQATTRQKGKGAELIVFGELVRRGADLYLPVIDTGIDAIIRKDENTYLEIQVKSTEEEEQAGYFNVYDLDKHPKDRFFIICVDFNKQKSLEEGKPNIWIIPATVFKEYMVSGYRLPIYETRRGDSEPRYKRLHDYFYTWKKLIE